MGKVTEWSFDWDDTIEMKRNHWSVNYIEITRTRDTIASNNWANTAAGLLFTLMKELITDDECLEVVCQLNQTYCGNINCPNRLATATATEVKMTLGVTLPNVWYHYWKRRGSLLKLKRGVKITPGNHVLGPWVPSTTELSATYNRNECSGVFFISYLMKGPDWSQCVNCLGWVYGVCSIHWAQLPSTAVRLMIMNIILLNMSEILDFW